MLQDDVSAVGRRRLTIRSTPTPLHRCCSLMGCLRSLMDACEAYCYTERGTLMGCCSANPKPKTVPRTPLQDLHRRTCCIMTVLSPSKVTSTSMSVFMGPILLAARKPMPPQHSLQTHNIRLQYSSGCCHCNRGRCQAAWHPEKPQRTALT